MTSSSRARHWVGRAAMPVMVFVACAAVYVAVLGERRSQTSPDDHYSHLAESYLRGQLSVVDNRPDGNNDWACFDTETKSYCPYTPQELREVAPGYNAWNLPAPRFRYYVSFPPLPALVVFPFVAARSGTDVPDRLIWAIFAGLAPALFFVLLRRLSETGRSVRRPWENLLLTALFAFGSVYFFTSVQGTVWFSAHVLASVLLFAYLYFGIDARRPILAGLMLGLAFLTRPTTVLLGLFFVIEVLVVSRRPGSVEGNPQARLIEWMRRVEWRPVVRKLALFSGPVLACGALMMWMNHARFDDPFEFGHRFLQIRWRPRILEWGLFNYHYLPKNLAVFVAALPWLSAAYPYIKISRHGLALWFTTPNLVQALWPKSVTPTILALWVAVIPVAVLDLMYQNSGWVQFGYRFALDYLPLLFVLLALTQRRIGPLFVIAAIFAVAINTFGAITFERAPQFYDNDVSQEVIFQPD